MKNANTQPKAPKAKPSKALADVRAYRQASGCNQMTFWPQFGCTQSGGSRYETGRNLPKSLAALIVLQEQGIVTDEQLAAAIAVVNASNAKR